MTENQFINFARSVFLDGSNPRGKEAEENIKWGIKQHLKSLADVNNSLTTEKNENQLFEAFLNGYDSGYDAKANDMINDNVGDAVRYVRGNYNEDFEL